MNEDVERAERELEKAFAQLGKLGSSQAVSKRNGVEAIYGDAYQRLVRLGAKPAIRAKYRRVTR